MKVLLLNTGSGRPICQLKQDITTDGLGRSVLDTAVSSLVHSDDFDKLFQTFKPISFAKLS